MSANSKIEWTHHTFNPWWGCTKVSPGCAHCYAESSSKRYGHDVWGDNAQRRFFGDKHWNEPLAWNAAAKQAGERHRVFCGSMCDVFEDRPELRSQRDNLFRQIHATPHLDWLLLTKRPENIQRMIDDLCWPESGCPMGSDLPPNVWLGTSVENQRAADERILYLLGVSATVHFLSIEPLLGDINLRRVRFPGAGFFDALDGRGHDGSQEGGEFHKDDSAMPPIDWAIVGGESGGGARPMHPDWARSLRDQCTAAGVAFFFKQWGEWWPFSQNSFKGAPEWKGTSQTFMYSGPPGPLACSESIYRVGKKAAGRLLDGREWNEFPQAPLVGANTKEQSNA